MSTEDELIEAIKYKRRGHKCDYWINGVGELHRVDGPAIVRDSGTTEWFLNDTRHRTDGPAIVRDEGTTEWFLNGKRHRTDGPAIEYNNGGKEWRLHGRLHREDGPAVDFANGTKYWYFNNELIDRSNQHLFDDEDGRCLLAQVYGRPK